MNALKNHTLVSQGWRVVRPDEQVAWHVFRVATPPPGHEVCGCWQFDRVWDALKFVDKGGKA